MRSAPHCYDSTEVRWAGCWDWIPLHGDTRHMDRATGIVLVIFGLLGIAATELDAQTAAYVLDATAAPDLEQVRPLFDRCSDWGSLERLREYFGRITDLEKLQPLLQTDPVVFSGCPAGIAMRGVTTLEGSAEALRLFLRRSSASAEPLPDLDFSLRDVERKCEVYRYSERYGEVECSGSALREVERKCEVYFYRPNEGEFECRGSPLRPLELKCTAAMYSDNYADVSCRGDGWMEDEGPPAGAE